MAECERKPVESEVMFRRCPRCADSDYPGSIRCDADEEACSATAVERLTEQHERILASIDRLTKGVEAAASGSDIIEIDEDGKVTSFRPAPSGP